MDPVVVLLGSGATLPAIPGVSDVTRHLREAPCLRLFREPDPSRMFSLIASRDDDPRPTLVDALSRRIEAYRQLAPNFEEVVHVLEQLDWLYPLAPVEPQSVARSPLLGAFLIPDEAWNVPNAYGQAADHVCKEVLRFVSVACDGVEAVGSAPLACFLRQLAQSTRLWIYSLNYDDVPERADLDFFTGYTALDCFDSSWSLPPLDQHAHLQLHGSVLNGGGGASPYVPPRHSTRGDALRARDEISHGPLRFQDGYGASRTGIITGMRKADGILAEPFATYFASLRAALYATDRWLIIGYGGGDTHINHLLTTALLHRRARPPRVALINFDPPGLPDDGFGVRMRRLLPWENDLSPLLDRHQGFAALPSGVHVSLAGAELAFTSGYAELLACLGI
jgi:hypothetical protein